VLSENASREGKIELNVRGVGLLHWGVHEVNK